MSPVLFYVADPMCSWCWGFHPVLMKVVDALQPDVTLRYVMGGLAKDSDDPMPAETREYVQINWRQVMQETGAEFNWDFWTNCQPRRSTYPACRAVIAAGFQREASIPEMFHRIQRAYYKEARNPSDSETLIALAEEVGLDKSRFERDLFSSETEDQLQEDFSLRRSLGVREFPGLVIGNERDKLCVVRGYSDFETTIARLDEFLSK